MKKVKTFIERNSKGTYFVYVDLDDNSLNYGIHGIGATQEEAINDFLQSYKDMKQIHQEEGKPFVEAEFSFEIDFVSHLTYYNQFIPLEAMQRLTKVKQSQLSDYINDRKKPTARTIEKIKNGLIKFKNDLQNLELA